MKTNLLAGAAVAAAVFAFGALAGPAHAQDASAGDAVNGKRVFLAVGCMYCHGRAVQGGALNYTAPPLAKTELPFEASSWWCAARCATCRPSSTRCCPKRTSPDIYAFVQSLPGRRDPKSIAILND